MPGKIAKLNEDIIQCRRCPRLVEWRESVARKKKRAFMHRDYWGKPVPGFGDIDGRIMVVGLAPGAHGSNRTGRMFTGDASGDFLFPALYKAGFASSPDAVSADDGLVLNDLFITATCRCVPPKNKPNRDEIENCREYLEREFTLMRNLQGIVALGGIAFRESLKLFSSNFGIDPRPRPRFSHGANFFLHMKEIPWLLASYHPSRQNTQTGRLTEEMFNEIWCNVAELLV